ncbi:MAG: L-threonylcarbamoyladenylate synthase [Victivallaceae bacterium]|nr:L-threonylcarbamoyladenylate synthase [Victivallaceae bacterium]
MIRRVVNEPDAVAVAAKILSGGGVVLLPTETVYGLVARADDLAAVSRIFQLKHRDAQKRLGWFVRDESMLLAHGVSLTGLPERLIRKYCPGAVTIIAPCADKSTLGFRIPDHAFVSALLAQIDFPLAQTSANRSGMPNALSCEEALSMLSGEVDLAVDGGAISPDALASTVVDATGTTLKILRQGQVRIAL